MLRSRLAHKGITPQADTEDDEGNVGHGTRHWRYLVALVAGLAIIALGYRGYAAPGPSRHSSSQEPLQQQERRRLEEDVCKCPPLPKPEPKQEARDSSVLMTKDGSKSELAKEGVLLGAAQSEECDTLAACRDPKPRCGVVDACGKKVFCGGCAFPEWCGGLGNANECGCRPQTCGSLKRTCGDAPDGCGGVLTCGVPCTPWALDPATDASPPPPERPYRLGYYVTKAQFRDGVEKFEVEDIDAKWFTHVIFSAAAVDKNTYAVTTMHWNDDDIHGDFVAKGKYRIFRDLCRVAGAVPMLSIGGTEFIIDKKGAEIMSSCVQNKGARTKLVESIVQWLQKYKFEGIELDWEPATKEDAAGLLSLLVELRGSFDQLSSKTGITYWLSVKAPANPVAADLAFPDKATLGRVVDWIAVMTDVMHFFDYDGSEPFVSSASPIHDEAGRLSIATAIGHWRRGGVPPNKLIAALTTTAIVWKLKDESQTNYGAEADGNAGKYGSPKVPYIKFVTDLPEYTVKDILHIPTSMAYAISGNKWASYDNPATIIMKVDYIVQQRLGGYIMCIDQDAHHELAKAAADRTMATYSIVPAKSGEVMLVSSGYAKPCVDPEGTLFILRALKNKVEYTQRHNMRLMYNQGNWNGRMSQMWSKVYILKNAMIHHPEVEWFMWMDADAFFTDLSFKIPFETYRYFNLVVPGFWKCIYEDSKPYENRPEWTCINSGVFLIRNCAWSMHMLDLWAEYSIPEKATEYGEFFSKIQRGRAEGQPSNDQSALVYLLHSQPEKIASLTYFEEAYKLHGFWEDIVSRYEEWLSKAGPRLQWDENSPPAFVTHFTGCKICGGRGSTYDKDVCTRNMKRALNFGDNQALLPYNMSHVNLVTPDLQDL